MRISLNPQNHKWIYGRKKELLIDKKKLLKKREENMWKIVYKCWENVEHFYFNTLELCICQKHVESSHEFYAKDYVVFYFESTTRCMICLKNFMLKNKSFIRMCKRL